MLFKKQKTLTKTNESLHAQNSQDKVKKKNKRTRNKNSNEQNINKMIPSINLPLEDIGDFKLDATTADLSKAVLGIEEDGVDDELSEVSSHWFINILNI